MKHEREFAKKKKTSRTRKTDHAMLKYLLWKRALILVRNNIEFSCRLNQIV